VSVVTHLLVNVRVRIDTFSLTGVDINRKESNVAASVAWNFITSAIPNGAAIACCIAGVSTCLATGRILKKRDGVLERNLVRSVQRRACLSRGNSRPLEQSNKSNKKNHSMGIGKYSYSFSESSKNEPLLDQMEVCQRMQQLGKC
jgi:hypothetical protein